MNQSEWQQRYEDAAAELEARERRGREILQRIQAAEGGAGYITIPIRRRSDS